MKTLVTLTATILLSAFILATAQEKQAFDVRCPNCLNKQILVATVTVNGGYATTNHVGTNSVAGTMQQRNASFHCPECHYDFIAPVKPDIFMPTMAATPVTIGVPGLRGPTMTAPVVTNTTGSGEGILRTIPTNDGYELVVIRRKVKQ